MQQEIAEIKFKHRDTLGAPSRPASEVSSMHSERSVESSIHSSASSAERKKIARADAAALKARLAYDAKAKEVEEEISNLEIDEELEKEKIESERKAKLKRKRFQASKEVDRLRTEGEIAALEASAQVLDDDGAQITGNYLNIIDNQPEKRNNDINLISPADEGDTSVFLHEKISGQENSKTVNLNDNLKDIDLTQAPRGSRSAEIQSKAVASDLQDNSLTQALRGSRSADAIQRCSYESRKGWLQHTRWKRKTVAIVSTSAFDRSSRGAPREPPKYPKWHAQSRKQCN